MASIKVNRKFDGLSRNCILFSGAFTLLLPTLAVAQTFGSDCVPTEDRPCYTLTPLDVERRNSITPPPNVELLDPAELGQTYECNAVTADTIGQTVGPVIRDCGPPAELRGFRPFYGTASSSTPPNPQPKVANCAALGLVPLASIDVDDETLASIESKVVKLTDDLACVDPEKLLVKRAATVNTNVPSTTVINTSPLVQNVNTVAKAPTPEVVQSAPTVIGGGFFGGFGGFGGGSIGSNQRVVVEGGGDTFVDGSVTNIVNDSSVQNILNDGENFADNSTNISSDNTASNPSSVATNSTTDNTTTNTEPSDNNGTSLGGGSSSSSSNLSGSSGGNSSSSSENNLDNSSSGGVDSPSFGIADSGGSSPTGGSTSSDIVSSGMTSSGIQSSGFSSSSGLLNNGTGSSTTNVSGSSSDGGGQIPEPAPLLLIALAGLVARRYLKRDKEIVAHGPYHGHGKRFI